MTTLLALDRPGCRCADCGIGEHKPLDDAGDADVVALLKGQVADHTDSRWSVMARPHGLWVTCSGTTKGWLLDDADITVDEVCLGDHGRARYDSAFALSYDARRDWSR